MFNLNYLCQLLLGPTSIYAVNTAKGKFIKVFLFIYLINSILLFNYMWPRVACNQYLNVAITNVCTAVIWFGPDSIVALFGLTSTKNIWKAKKTVLSRASHIFGPWITWNSCTAAALSNPNQACQPLSFPVHYFCCVWSSGLGGLL